MNKLKCKEDLYKSTYKGYAFTKGEQYEVVEKDKSFIWLKDNLGNNFSFSIKKNEPFYYVGDYFEIN